MSDTGDENHGHGDDDFLLYDAGVIERLFERGFFREAIAQFYIGTAREFGCNIDLSERRIGDAHDYWLGDVERTLTSSTDDETTELDHFKHGAFIAFWLRRLVIINDIWFRPEDHATSIAGESVPSVAQIQFYRFGNEICALYAGFFICLAYETYAKTERLRQGDVTRVITDATYVQAIPDTIRNEYPKLLKHKNVSPHALYMLYRSLFDTLQWNIQGRE